MRAEILALSANDKDKKKNKTKIEDLEKDGSTES